jgi:hypothetical protein
MHEDQNFTNELHTQTGHNSSTVFIGMVATDIKQAGFIA